MEDKTQEKINQLSLMEQSLQQLLLQKQQFQSQLVEINSALKELGSTEKAYKIVGNIMISAKKSDLTQDLSQKKEIVELRIKTIEKQEKLMKEKASAMQKEVMEKLQEK